MKKAIIVIVVLAVLGVFFYVYTKKEVKAPTVENSFPTAVENLPSRNTTTPQTQTNANSSQPANTAPPQEAGGENLGSNIQVYEADYDGAKYSPDALNLKVGDYVFFKNKSSGDFWPVAGSQSTIAAYPKFNPQSPITRRRI